MNTAVITEKNRIVIDLALQYNCWIKYSSTWYTPKEFASHYGRLHNIGYQYIKILNPLRSIERGQLPILDKVDAGMLKLDLKEVLRRYFELQNKVIREKYQPCVGQVDGVPLPFMVQSP